MSEEKQKEILENQIKLLEKEIKELKLFKDRLLACTPPETLAENIVSGLKSCLDGIDMNDLINDHDSLENVKYQLNKVSLNVNMLEKVLEE